MGETSTVISTLETILITNYWTRPTLKLFFHHLIWLNERVNLKFTNYWYFSKLKLTVAELWTVKQVK